MKKYHIQIEHLTENLWDWITIYSNSDTEALLSATYKVAHEQKYQGYYVDSIFSVEPVDDTIVLYNNTIQNTQEDTFMPSNTFMQFNVNWGNYTETLSKIAIEENWSNPTYPNNGILKNYLTHTYNKIKSDNSLISTPEYALFNTGLFTKYYEPIYAYTTDSKNVTFLTEYELGGKGIEKYPDRANFFANPELLLFDWHYKINVQYKHILEDEDNRKRLPKFVQESDISENILEGIINKSIKMVMANYKLAIPQYYDNKIQLLIPLFFTNSGNADLALVVTKIGNIYQGHTCITLDMAYNNARLIAKPENNWLSQ